MPGVFGWFAQNGMLNMIRGLESVIGMHISRKFHRESFTAQIARPLGTKPQCSSQFDCQTPTNRVCDIVAVLEISEFVLAILTP
jgi:hypothetical protein